MSFLSFLKKLFSNKKMLPEAMVIKPNFTDEELKKYDEFKNKLLSNEVDLNQISFEELAEISNICDKKRKAAEYNIKINMREYRKKRKLIKAK